MVNKQRIRDIEKLIGLEWRKEFEEAVRAYVRFCYRTWTGPPRKWPEIRSTRITRVEMVGSTRDPINLEILKTIKAGGKGAKRLLVASNSHCIDEKYQLCMEMRDPGERPLIFCPKTDWRRRRSRERCRGCMRTRMIHEFSKTGKLTSSTMEFPIEEFEIPMVR